ncbi:hypothetical protein DBL06_25820 [Agrobacterium pusense]|nr:hypothetical protein DBL06_25820 [Agrobacterium pusense]
MAFIPIYQAAIYHEQDAAAVVKTDPAVLDQVAKQAEILTRIASQLQEENSEVAMVVVRRNAILRQGPSKYSPKVRTLMSGDMAVLLDTADGWTRVEVADPLTNMVTVGWVFSKLVARVD